MTTAVSSAASSSSAISGSTTATSAQGQQDRFLKLLVAQMQNQDPLNPMDNAQVTTQMAQLSTVTGIEKLNATLQAYTQDQSYQAASLIGHSVLAPGNAIALSNGTGVGGADLSQAADSVSVSIMNSSGQVVNTLNLGKQNAGVVAFTWDGKTSAGAQSADGAYTFKVNASLGGASVTNTPLAVGRVDSVLLSSGGSTLNVAGMGEVSLADVRQVM